MLIRDWDHQQSNSTTDDTDDERRTKGINFFSHGNYSLTHQHWIQQAESAGSFDVHDTQGPESGHKLSMHLTAARVRHLQPNKTQEGMLGFVCNYMVFEELWQIVPHLDKPRSAASRVLGQISLPLRTLIPGVKSGVDVTMGDNLTAICTQGSLLHCEARIARVELLDLVCENFGLPKTRRSYTALETLEWTFGQKMVTVNGDTYYATDSRYTAFGNNQRVKRRAIFRMKGRETVRCTLPDGTDDSLPTALCCQAVCFFNIAGLYLLQQRFKVSVPPHLTHDVVDDSMNLMLVRWFSPHPSTFERDELFRPICPGPFRQNHCLWQFAKTERNRKCICNDDGTPNPNFHEHRHMFGDTNRKIMECFEDEKLAYYDVLSPLAIESRVNMTREYSGDTLGHSDTWIETITLI